MSTILITSVKDPSLDPARSAEPLSPLTDPDSGGQLIKNPAAAHLEILVAKEKNICTIEGKKHTEILSLIIFIYTPGMCRCLIKFS
jgi:hypothetical protein